MSIDLQNMYLDEVVNEEGNDILNSSLNGNFPFSKNNKGQSIYTGNEESEVDRINRQNDYLNKYVITYLDKIFSNYDSPMVLDVGCSDGRNILLRLKGRSYCSLLGIDRNHDKIEKANKLFKSCKNTFLCCDINSDNFHHNIVDYLRERGKQGFDIIHISSVLLHIENPGHVLNLLHSYLSENGRIFIQDEDDGLNKVFPYEDSFEDCFYVWDHSLESGDRKMGRKIPYLLEKCGYSDIKVLSSNITSLDFNGSMKDYFWDLYFNCELWVANDVSFYDTPDAYERYLKYKSKYLQLRDSYKKGKYFIMLGVLFITANK